MTDLFNRYRDPLLKKRTPDLVHIVHIPLHLNNRQDAGSSSFYCRPDNINSAYPDNPGVEVCVDTITQ
jgi:hypothetical protein